MSVLILRDSKIYLDKELPETIVKKKEQVSLGVANKLSVDFCLLFF